MTHLYRFLNCCPLLAGLLGIGQHGLALEAQERLPFVWPTPNRAFFEKRSFEAYVQPTASGKIESGLFGCVRNGGRVFHEGIDLKAVYRDKSGEALDRIVAAMPGRIVYVNHEQGNSSYGRYIVIEHDTLRPAVYTLYAHLKTIDKTLTVGKWVGAGASLGVMGRSAAGYSIPKSRAHLHFEIGLRLSDHFQKWYDKQSFRTENHHGIWNGINLAGLDPYDFFQTLQSPQPPSLSMYIKSLLPTAFTLQVTTSQMPDFVIRYPELLEGLLPDSVPVTGWEIDFTTHGFPKQWKPLTLPKRKAGVVSLLYYDEQLTENDYWYAVTSNEIKKPLRTRLEVLLGL